MAAVAITQYSSSRMKSHLKCGCRPEEGFKNVRKLLEHCMKSGGQLLRKNDSLKVKSSEQQAHSRSKYSNATKAMRIARKRPKESSLDAPGWKKPIVLGKVSLEASLTSPAMNFGENR